MHLNLMKSSRRNLIHKLSYAREEQDPISLDKAFAKEYGNDLSVLKKTGVSSRSKNLKASITSQLRLHKLRKTILVRTLISQAFSKIMGR